MSIIIKNIHVTKLVFFSNFAKHGYFFDNLINKPSSGYIADLDFFQFHLLE